MKSLCYIFLKLLFKIRFYHDIFAGLVPRRNSFKRVPLAESNIRINVPFSEAEAIKHPKNI